MVDGHISEQHSGRYRITKETNTDFWLVERSGIDSDPTKAESWENIVKFNEVSRKVEDFQATTDLYLRGEDSDLDLLTSSVYATRVR